MKTRRFLVYSLIYIALVGVFVYTMDNSDYTLNLLGMQLSLPIAVWFMLPVGIFALLAFLHMLYHSVGFYTFKRALNKDNTLYNNLAKEVLLGLETNKEFKTDTYKISAQMVRALSPWDRYSEISLDNGELSGVLALIKSVKNGEIVDLKKFKLPKDNPLNIQNELNKIAKVSNYYLEILKNSAETNMQLVHAAHEKLIALAAYADIKRTNLELSANEKMTILSRFIDDDIAINPDEIYDLLNDAKISKQQYLTAAIKLKDKLRPEAFLSIFEKLKNEHADAEEAYIYALYELGMLDNVREALTGSDVDEFKEIKTLMFLRDHGKNTSSSLFFK